MPLCVFDSGLSFTAVYNYISKYIPDNISIEQVDMAPIIKANKIIFIGDIIYKQVREYLQKLEVEKAILWVDTPLIPKGNWKLDLPYEHIVAVPSKYNKDLLEDHVNTEIKIIPRCVTVPRFRKRDGMRITNGKDVILEKEYLINVNTGSLRKAPDAVSIAYQIALKQGFPKKLVMMGKNIYMTDAWYPFDSTKEQKEYLRYIYNAGACIYLSASEGFGLPVLECRALGIPVIYSNTEAIKRHASGIPVQPLEIALREFDEYYLPIPTFDEYEIVEAMFKIYDYKPEPIEKKYTCSEVAKKLVKL